MTTPIDPNVLLKIALLTPNPQGGWGVPMIYWGDPGVAKSALIEAWAKRLGIPCKVLSPSEHGDGAFGVTPVPFGVGDGQVIHYPKPAWVAELEEEAGAILFIDELNTPASSHLFGPMLAMIHAKRVAGATLPQHVRVVGAANPIESAAGGLEIPLSVANRMGHFQWQLPDKKAWNSFLMTRAGVAAQPLDLAVEEAKVMNVWGVEFAKAAAMVAGFTTNNIGAWHQMPKATDPTKTPAWPSLRTWDLAAHAMAGAMIHGASGEVDAVIAGFVGEAAALEFATYRSSMDLPDPEKLLDGQIQWAHDKQRLDVSYAVFSTCSALVVTDKDKTRREARAAKLWGLMETVATGGDADLCYDAAHAMTNNGNNLDRDTPALAKASQKVLTSMHLAGSIA